MALASNRRKRVQISGIARKSNRRRGNGKRRLNKRLPHKQKRHQPAPAPRPVRFAKKNVRSARPWHRRAQLGPDESIERGQRSSRNPSDQSLRPAHRFDYQRGHDKWANAHNLDHVERDGLFQAQAALQSRGLHASRVRYRRALGFSPSTIFARGQHAAENSKSFALQLTRNFRGCPNLLLRQPPFRFATILRPLKLVALATRFLVQA